MIGILHCFPTCWISHTGLVIKGHVKRSTCVGMSSVPPYYEKDGKVHFLIRGISPHQWNKKNLLRSFKIYEYQYVCSWQDRKYAYKILTLNSTLLKRYKLRNYRVR